MNTYLLLPFASCAASLMLAVFILVRDSTRRVSWLGATLAVAGAWWSACELFWNSAHDPAIVLMLVRLSAPGWLLLGPVILHIFLESSGHPARHEIGKLRALYASAIALAVIDITTPWIHPAVVKTSWGWGFEVGPLFLVSLMLATIPMALGMTLAFRHYRSSGSPAERRQLYWVLGGLSVPLVIASLTDGLAPILGHQVPRFGAASITLMIVVVATMQHRFGYSLLAPGTFAPEILATLRDGVALLRADGHVHLANLGMERLVGALAGSLEGRELSALLGADAASSILAKRGLDDLECTLQHESGEPVPVSITTSTLRDRESNPIGLVLVARDLREIASLRSRLITSGRLASVGQLAAGIAHEINNPVAYVRANLGVLTETLESVRAKLPAELDESFAEVFDEGRELIADSLDGVDRVAAIVRDVKGFAHAGQDGWQVVEMNPLLESVIRVAAPQLRYVERLECDYGEVPTVQGAPQELKQVFLNLLVNASQAVENGEAIWVRTRSEPGRVIIEVEDEGCGIPEDVIERIYDPFFTTKPVGEGTGLGLSISYQIVRAHGGELSVRSRPGQGTLFRVELPTAAPERMK